MEEYKPGKCLTVSYWREMTARDPKAEVGYRFSVQVDPHDPAQPLMVFHVPPLSTAEAVLAEQAIRSEQISMERLLVHTIYVRTKARLGELKQELQHRLNLGDVEASLHGSPAVLSVPILHPCMRSEQLLVTVDTHTGGFLAHVPQYEENPVTPDIQQTLNEDKSRYVWCNSRVSPRAALYGCRNAVSNWFQYGNKTWQSRSKCNAIKNTVGKE